MVGESNIQLNFMLFSFSGRDVAFSVSDSAKFLNVSQVEIQPHSVSETSWETIRSTAHFERLIQGHNLRPLSVSVLCSGFQLSVHQLGCCSPGSFEIFVNESFHSVWFCNAAFTWPVGF